MYFIAKAFCQCISNFLEVSVVKMSQVLLINQHLVSFYS